MSGRTRSVSLCRVDHTTRTQGPPLDAAERDRLLEHIARLGEREVGRRIPLSRHALGRAIGGLSVTRGTAAQIRLWLREQADTELLPAQRETGT